MVSMRLWYAVSVYSTALSCSSLMWVIRCMEHSLHLTAKYFVQTIVPHCNKKTRTSEADEDSGAASDDGGDNNSNNGNSEAIEMGDLLGKAITLVKQVIHSVALLTCTLMCTSWIHKSPQARVFFCASCNQVRITPLELLLWIRMHWGLLFSFLKHFIKLKLVCQLILSFANLNCCLTS